MLHKLGTTQFVHERIVEAWGKNWLIGLYTFPLVLLGVALLCDTLIRADRSVVLMAVKAVKSGVVGKDGSSSPPCSRKNLNEPQISYLAMER